MDRYEAMSVLVKVVDCGSLSEAARQLGLPLATVSRRVSDLEAQLGARLLNRSTRSLALTDAGRDYVAACRRILDDVAEAERTAAGEFTAPRGDLVITAPQVFGRMHMLPTILAYLANYPDVDARLVLGDRLANLLEEQIDVALRIGELPDSNLRALRVGAIGQVVCAAPSYLAACGRPTRLEQLSEHACITFDALMSGRRWVFHRDGHEQALSIRSRLIVNSAEAAIDAACAGLGITRVLSYQVESALSAGSLELLLREYEPAPLPVNLLYGGGERVPAKLRTFLDFAAPRLRERLATAAR